jgi:hypothetical protein
VTTFLFESLASFASWAGKGSKPWRYSVSQAALQGDNHFNQERRLVTREVL